MPVDAQITIPALLKQTVGLAIRKHSRAMRTKLTQRNVDLTSSLERMLNV